MTAVARYCGCGCGEQLDSTASERTKYRPRHRQRAYRRRVERAAEAAGVPARLNLQTLDSTNGTGERNGDAHSGRGRATRASRPGVSVYFPRPELVGVAIDAIQCAELDDVHVAEVAAALERARARAARRFGGAE